MVKGTVIAVLRATTHTHTKQRINTMIADSKNRLAEPDIQNHINWCWAVAAKIVGIEYCLRNQIPCPVVEQTQKGSEDVIRKDTSGLRLNVCGSYQGEITVNAVQLSIVERAKDPINNPDGNQPEGDPGKARVLRYIITGNPESDTLSIQLVGFYANPCDLLSTAPLSIAEAISLGNPFIGNYQRQDGTFHSIVLTPLTESTLVIYDPWDGYREQFSKLQLFRSGFLTNQGPGIIKWIQYIRPNDTNDE